MWHELRIERRCFPVDKNTEQTNAKLAETYGVQPQKPTLDNSSISKMAGSLKCFDESHHSYTAFSETMQGIEATMPQPKKKTVLTDSDRKLIDALISPNYPALAQTDAINIAKADSRLAEILSLDERYGAGVSIPPYAKMRMVSQAKLKNRRRS